MVIQQLVCVVCDRMGGSYTESPELLKELVKQVATHIGPFARPGMIVGTPGLPKTRSGQFFYSSIYFLPTLAFCLTV